MEPREAIPHDSGLSERRQDLLRLLLEERRGARAAGRPHQAGRAERSGMAPLSLSQERIWFFEQLHSGTSAYNMPLVVRIKGRLRASVLEQALSEVIRRHQVLRSTIRELNGAAFQVTGPSVHHMLPIVDLTGLEESDIHLCAEGIVDLDVRMPFDLVCGPLLRSLLVSWDAEDHIFALTLQHIVSDTWSNEILASEISALYESFSTGAGSPLDDPCWQYGDFSIWQREWLKGDEYKSQLSYWKKALQDVPAILDLPTDRQRPAIQTYSGTFQLFRLQDDTYWLLKETVKTRGATVFMVLMAVFQSLLHRYTGNDALLIAVPTANRNVRGVEGLIGFFANTLAIRADLSDGPNFDDLLARVKETAISAYMNQNIPFQKLVEELQPNRDARYSTFLQVSFMVQTEVISAFRMPGLEVQFAHANEYAVRFDLGFSALDQPGAGLTARLEYNTDLFDTDTIDRMLSHFQVLAHSALARPGRKLADLAILSDAEKHHLTREWSDTVTERGTSGFIPSLLEAHSSNTPDRIVLAMDGSAITYSKLNRRSNQLACYLRRLAVSTESLIGVLMDRSIDMVVALMGILKAGAAYVPLDSIYPEPRILTILADAEVSVLLTCSGFWKDSSSSLTFAIDLESRWEEIAQECDECPQSGASSDNMAYVIYTSGSTGAPKGVEVTHGSVVNLLQAVAKHPGLCEQDVLLSVTTITFDIAGLELFLPMSVGARTALATREVASDPESLVREIALSQATIMQATPATWRGLCDSLSGTADLRMLAGGEEIDPALASSLVRRGRGTVLWNLYGPTETTIWSSAWLVEDDRPPIPIGRPIDNTQLYVVDPDCQLLPIGVCGQLAISGKGLARGYLGLPEQTAEKFFPDPQADFPGGRMYQTGDIVRFRRDGALEYQGRRDSQVKVRGHRIDLEEIESVIRRHSAVRDVVVVARRGQSNDIRLAAYVASPPDLSISDLRNYVRGRLPEYMVPSSFVRLVSLPLTPNGKINRKLLQSHIPEEPEARGPGTPPRTPIEAALATIWKDILGEKRLDIADNFFDVGGHSILANQVVSRVHSEFGVRLPLLSVFESPTLVEFTVAIAKKQAEKVDIRQVEAILDELETGRLNPQ